MVPVLEALVGAFPFRVLGFHSVNGSEFINHRVADMLNKLHVEDFTKSRPRRSNDNAPVGGARRDQPGCRPEGSATTPSSTAWQLAEYFAGARRTFDIPLVLPRARLF